MVEFQPAADSRRSAESSAPAGSSSSEQSNSSVVFDDTLILKIFRRLEPGVNPELEVLRFLADAASGTCPRSPAGTSTPAAR